ncbi:hypothetical protein AAT19DRAFT_9541 [Rhodotorula toruloides]|uniref:Uncharacterized protein n=1 Tax=Rhodotorula toruloides TaxID=5286 RepID=A0A2T0A2H5_RHOTO|nr:hypothetical protein AAT19DRAFT_9541 [Rhodotorula toruloides]
MPAGSTQFLHERFVVKLSDAFRTAFPGGRAGRRSEVARWRKGVLSDPRLSDARWRVMRGSEEGRGQIAAIEERLEADEQKMKAVSPPVFLNLAKAAVGLEAYEHVMGDKQSWSDADAERLGREYGRQLARLCGPPILYQLHAVLKRMASVAGGPEGSAWLKGNEPELVAQWQQMDGMQQETLLRRCEHALQHTEEFVAVGLKHHGEMPSPAQVVAYLPTAEVLLQTTPLLPQQPVEGCPACTQEHQAHTQHSLDRRRFIPTSRRDTLLRKGW